MKETFDKVVMDVDTKSQMRETLVNYRKPAGVTKLVPIFSVAAAIALVMAIPFTRTAMVGAAERVFSSFRTHNGTEVTVFEEPEETEAFVAYNEEAEYARLKDGRIYFVLDGEWTDVTDQCNDTDAFCHEIINEDGSRELIIIGGTPQEGGFGWWSLLFDSDGKYVWNHGSIPEALCEHGDPLWLQKVCEKEGVPFNDGQYDFIAEGESEEN